MSPTPSPLYPLPTRSGFWSGETLSNRLHEVISPWDHKQVEFATYLLAVGEDIYVTPVGDKDALTRTKHKLKSRESYAIPPGQLALITTREKVTVPADATAFIAMRSKFKFRGLINVSGFSVDPGYSGTLIFAVYNAGPSPVHVTEGERWFTIFFADLDREASVFVREPAKSHSGITSEQITAISADFLTLKGLDTKILESEQKLEERLKSLERDNAVIRWSSALIIAFLLAFSVRSCVQGGPSTTASVIAEAVKASSRSNGTPLR